MFEGFTAQTDSAPVFGVQGGSGPAVLLLHGIPQTHVMWRLVAPVLARERTVVATDLRGYGASGMCASASDHAPYAMRELAKDQVQAMRALGHERFAAVGHDRGARCAYRMALDHPEAVQALGVLDIVPTGESFARADARFALGFWVWSFLAAAHPVPEQLIAANPDALVDHMLDAWSSDSGCFPAEVREQYRAQFRDSARVRAICEQYRAAAALDVAHDEADRGRLVEAPTLALWSAHGALAQWYDPLDIWRQWAREVVGQPIDCGHFLPEEAPEQTTSFILAFLRSHLPERSRPLSAPDAPREHAQPHPATPRRGGQIAASAHGQSESSGR